MAESTFNGTRRKPVIRMLVATLAVLAAGFAVNVTMAAPAAAAYTCPHPGVEKGWICLWEHSNRQGNIHRFNSWDDCLTNNYFYNSSLTVNDNTSSLQLTGAGWGNGVDFYQHCWLGGSHINVVQGSNNVRSWVSGQFWNDTISSFEMP